MTMTNLNTGIIAGSAYRGRICGSSYNTGFVRDNSNFNGLLAATHELGHLLNLPHDGQSNAKGCVSYQADKRAASIMAPYDLAVDKYYWSRCSKKILHDFATTKGCECMKYPYRR
ncbi:venom metalloproteinase 3-like [Phymastichus coffea]|uniref:venom metalloproteinase 3-like n=1 Tax=Phymastichus coffea TaxID=108790 RepID=UPI00273AC97D|nr:venom metalloproteinase 3-like [Phymastichus coffea]